jgi:tetratricopeptide (TPR) repeat protein
MSRLQIIIVSLGVLLLAVLYFGVRTSPLSQKEVESSRAESVSKASINDIINQAKSDLTEAERNQVGALESELDIAGNDSTRLDIFKNLSSLWYSKRNFATSGFYAEEVAQIDKSDSAWSIAGINYALCFTNTKNERIHGYCYEKALTAFENAASIAPDSMVYKENLAYCYTQNEDFEQVMKGVMIYRGILEQDSTNVKVLLALGKMSVERSGDYGKAVGRLESAIRLAPNNLEANLLLAQTYVGLNRKSEAKKYYQKALSLTNSDSLKKNIKDSINNL